MRVLIGIIEHIVDIGSYVPNKAGKDRDTVSVEPGSRQFFGSVSVSESRFFGYLVLKRHFLLILKILYVCLKSLDTVSVSESPTQIFCIGTSLGPKSSA